MAQTTWWHGAERQVRYRPDGEDFVIRNGDMRFNRALYGTNTAFRVEAGDLPEFALYLPGVGGNFHLGVVGGGQSKWLTEADRKSVVSGKSVSVRVDLGGRRIIKTKKKIHKRKQTY